MNLSCIIPAFNASSTILDALASISHISQCEQIELDVIVVEDGSLDADFTSEIVRESGISDIRLIAHPENRGKIAAINSGIKHCRGEWVIILDADDQLLPNAGSVLRDAIRASDGDLIFGASIDQNGVLCASTRDIFYSSGFGLKDLLFQRVSGEYLPVVRVVALAKIGGYVTFQDNLGCEMLTYLQLLKHRSGVIVAQPVRRYNVGSVGGISDAYLKTVVDRNHRFLCTRQIVTRYKDWIFSQPAGFRWVFKLWVYSALCHRDLLSHGWEREFGFVAMSSKFFGSTLRPFSSLVIKAIKLAKQYNIVRRFG